VKRRRAGNGEGRPCPAPPIDRSTRSAEQPARIASIRGLPALADERMQTEVFWRETWGLR